MELQDTAASRIHIGFPLGLALLFASLLFICGFFCCCLHWKRLQSLFRSYGFINPQPRIQADLPSYDQKLAFPVVVITSHAYTQKAINLCFKRKMRERVQI